MENIEITNGPYKGYKGELLDAGKRNKNERALINAGKQSFNVFQLKVSIENLDKIKDGERILVTDGQFKNFTGIFYISNNIEKKSLIILDDVKGFKTFSKDDEFYKKFEKQKNSDKIFRVMAYTSTGTLKLNLYENQFKILKKINKDFNEKKNMVIDAQKEDDEMDGNDDNDDVDNRDLEDQILEFNDEENANMYNNEISYDEAEVENTFVSTFKDQSRITIGQTDDVNDKNLLKLISGLARTFGFNLNENDSIFNIMERVKIIKDFVMSKKTYMKKRIPFDLQGIAAGSLISNSNVNIDSIRNQMKTNDQDSRDLVTLYAGMDKLLKRGINLSFIDDYDLMKLGTDINEVFVPEIIEVSRTGTENLKRKNNSDIPEAYIPKKSKFLVLEDVQSKNYSGQYLREFSEEDKNEIEKKLEIKNEMQKDSLLKDEINRVRMLEWEKDGSVWVPKIGVHKPTMTLNPNDSQSFQYALDNYNEIIKTLDDFGIRRITLDDKLSGTIKEMVDNNMSMGISSDQIIDNLASEFGASRFSITSRIKNTFFTDALSMETFEFGNVFFEFMSSSFKNTLDRSENTKYGTYVKSIHAFFVKETNINISYEYFLEFMKIVYGNKINNKNFMKGLQYRKESDIVSREFFELNMKIKNNFIGNLDETNNTVFKLLSDSDSIRTVEEFIQGTIRLRTEDEIEKPYNVIYIRDIYDNYENYLRRNKQDAVNMEVFKHIVKEMMVLDNNPENSSGRISLLDKNGDVLYKRYTYVNNVFEREIMRQQVLDEIVIRAWTFIFGGIEQEFKGMVPDISEFYSLAHMIIIGNKDEIKNMINVSDKNIVQHIVDTFGSEIIGFESKVSELIDRIKKEKSMSNVSNLITAFMNNWDQRENRILSEDFQKFVENFASTLISSEKRNVSKEVKEFYDSNKSSYQYYLTPFLRFWRNSNITESLEEWIGKYLIEPLEEIRNDENNIYHNLFNFKNYSRNPELMDSEKVIDDYETRKSKALDIRPRDAVYDRLDAFMRRKGNSKNKKITFENNFINIRKVYGVDQDLWDLTMEFIEQIFIEKYEEKQTFKVYSQGSLEIIDVNVDPKKIKSEINKKNPFTWTDLHNILSEFESTHLPIYLENVNISFTNKIKFLNFFIRTIKFRLSEMSSKNNIDNLLLSENKFVVYFLSLIQTPDFTIERFFRLLSTEIYGTVYEDFIDSFKNIYINRKKNKITVEQMMKNFEIDMRKNNKIIWSSVGDYKNSSLYKNYLILFKVIEFICFPDSWDHPDFELNEELIIDLMSPLIALEYQIKKEITPQFLKYFGIPLSSLKLIAKKLKENMAILDAQDLILKSNPRNNSKYYIPPVVSKSSKKKYVETSKDENYVIYLSKKYLFLEKLLTSAIENPGSDFVDYIREKQKQEQEQIDFRKKSNEIESSDSFIDIPIKMNELNESVIDIEYLKTKIQNIEKEISELSQNIIYTFEVSENKNQYSIKHTKNVSMGSKNTDEDITSTNWKKESVLYMTGNISDVMERKNLNFYFLINYCLYSLDLIFYNKETDAKYAKACSLY